MNAGNRAGCSVTVHGIERDGIGEAEHELAVRGGDVSAHSLGRNRACSSRIDGLHVDARFVTRLRAAKYNIRAIREKTGVTPVDGIMRDLLDLPRAKGNQKKLTRNVQNKRR